MRRFASAPSATVPALCSKGLARTVGTGVAALQSAPLATVRRSVGSKPLPEPDFAVGMDDADGADGCAPALSGAEWLGVVVMWMVRVLCPSLLGPKPISTPTFRKKVAARRSLPASARGLSGQALALAARSPTTSARAPRRSEAVPVHTVRLAIMA